MDSNVGIYSTISSTIMSNMWSPTSRIMEERK